MPLEKVDEFRWRIPVHGGMRVPGMVYADERLMAAIRQDQSLQQVANVAHLPGIVSASIAMPDIHWGYGFSIGGVAAVDVDEGVVSPGGIGYDINCLSGDSWVLFPEGFTRPIREIVEEGGRQPVTLFDRRCRDCAAAPVVAGLAQRPRRPVREIQTAGTRSLVATTDHPLLTPNGMRSAGKLRPGDRVAVLPFEGVPYEDPGHRVLVDVEDIRGAARQEGLGEGGRRMEQVLGHLRPLLPLTADHPALPTLLKVAGLVLGDGAISFVGERRKGVISITGHAQDLRDVATHLRPWVTVSRVYARDRKHRIETQYGPVRFESREHFVHVRSTGFALLLVALGIPSGPKATRDWGLPEALRRLPAWQKRLFLAGFFGAELSSPKPFEDRACNFYVPVLSVNKHEGFVASGRRFLRDVSAMLAEFGVGTLKILERREQMNKDGLRSIRLRLLLSGREESLRALWSRVGYEYNRSRALLASHATAYLRLKSAALGARDRVRARIVEIRRERRWGAKRLLAAVGSTGPSVNLRFVERTIYGRADRRLRAPEGFPTFRQWRREAARGLGRSGAVWEEIEAIVARPDVDRVYDITVAHRDHNFVANGFVVHN
ncbi:MAG: RtcB family protein [Planctomycetales bacterium]|nr:RtcB family protein [Planctomycetales bacterium]